MCKGESLFEENAETGMECMRACCNNLRVVQLGAKYKSSA